MIKSESYTFIKSLQDIINEISDVLVRPQRARGLKLKIKKINILTDCSNKIETKNRLVSCRGDIFLDFTIPSSRVSEWKSFLHLPTIRSCSLLAMKIEKIFGELDLQIRHEELDSEVEKALSKKFQLKMDGKKDYTAYFQSSVILNQLIVLVTKDDLAKNLLQVCLSSVSEFLCEHRDDIIKIIPNEIKFNAGKKSSIREIKKIAKEFREFNNSGLNGGHEGVMPRFYSMRHSTEIDQKVEDIWRKLNERHYL